MLKLTVNLDERSYPIYIGQSALQDNGRLVHHIGDCRPIIITNDSVAPLYLQGLLDSLADLDPLSFVIPDGEQYKSLEWFEKISSVCELTHSSVLIWFDFYSNSETMTGE